MNTRIPTEKQRAVLEFLWSFQQRMGRTPTGPEIATHFRFRDASSAYQHLRLLAAKGCLEIVRSGRKTPLAVRLTDLAKNLLQASYPLFGTIPAGPLEMVMVDADRAVSSIEDLIPDLKPGDYFLTVEGDSMIDAGLIPGMLVVIRPSARPKTGDLLIRLTHHATRCSVSWWRFAGRVKAAIPENTLGISVPVRN